MRYTISHEFTANVVKYIHRDFPSIEWTEDEMLALRMHPERAAYISYQLMLTGMSHTIKQVSL